jgi:hypothetical protein
MDFFCIFLELFCSLGQRRLWSAVGLALRDFSAPAAFFQLESTNGKMSFFGASAAFNSTFALSNTLTDIYENNVNDWKYGSNTAWWASNSLSNYNKAADQIYGSNTASWTSNTLSNYALSNGQSNWNWASNTAKWCCNTLSNYALIRFQSNWFYASNTASWTSNYVIENESNWNYGSNTAAWASNDVAMRNSNLDYGSNTSRWLSNMVMARSSNWDYASNTARWASNEIGMRDSNWDYASNTAKWASNEIGIRDSNWDYASNTGRWASNEIGMRDSNWDYASNAARWASNEIGLRDSNLDYGSNTARWASNTAQWASNYVGVRDSNWDFGSNTARWASNEIGMRDSNWDFGSNTARWASNEVGMRDSNWDFGSNTARWASNEIGMRDSNLDYGSNTARWASNTAQWASNYVGGRDSNWDYGSNAAQWSSNYVGLRDSNWDYGSNTARWASNYVMTLSNDRVNWVNVNADPPTTGNPVGSYGSMTYNLLNSNVSYIDYTGVARVVVNNLYLSNTARWGSNAAMWSSNEIGKRDSNWDYASNVARWASNTAAYGSNAVRWASNTAAYASNNMSTTVADPTYWNTRGTDMWTTSYVSVGTSNNYSGFDVRMDSYFSDSVVFGKYTAAPDNRVVINDPMTLTIIDGNGIDFMSSFALNNSYFERGVYSSFSGLEVAVDNSTKTAVGWMSIDMMTHSGGSLAASPPGGTNLKSIPDATLRAAMFFWPDNNGRITMWGYTAGSYRFELGVDSAAKPGSGTWAVTSDERVKEDIVLADLDLCYDNVKKIPLKHFKWKYEHFDDEQIYDRRKLGWIAQDVEKVFKKAVRTNPNHPTVPNCKSLDADQVYACMYGTIQKLQEMCEAMQARIDALEARV